MNMYYKSSWDGSKQQAVFDVVLQAKLELTISGSTVFLFLGFWDPEAYKWDYLRCAVDYDGVVNANAQSRPWVVTDHTSTNKP